MFYSIKFHKMHLAEYLLLGSKASNILGKYDETELQLVKPKTKITAALNKLEDNLKISPSSMRTSELAAKDLRRDNGWKCFMYLVISQSYNEDATIRTHAEKLVTVVRSPEMRIYDMGYQDQTVSMINFFNKVDSNEELKAAITGIGADNHYAFLKTSQQDFIAKEEEKNKEEAEKPNAEGAKAAKEVRKAIESLDQFLSVMKDMTEKVEYENIAAEINEVIKDINSRIAARETRRENAKEEETTTLQE
ncbi:DUF6261 family protein [Marinifilum fragile]|uniref:DUF6261 family protein n=1 Tax=Marinifilum fragile TaxID=570161 RepID=UPI002AAB39E8|nr:DUF6261 family protein [Marinifilum fragile]